KWPETERLRPTRFENTERLLARGRSLAIRRHLIDDVRQYRCHRRLQHVRIDSELRSNLIQRIAVQDAVELVRRNRQVLTGADPRTDDSAEPFLLKHPLESRDTAHLRAVDVVRHRAQRAGVLFTEQRAANLLHFIENTHRALLRPEKIGAGYRSGHPTGN